MVRLVQFIMETKSEIGGDVLLIQICSTMLGMVE